MSTDTHTPGSVYDCPNPRCKEYVAVGLAQDKGEPAAHRPQEEAK
jgi:hypothetical protein